MKYVSPDVRDYGNLVALTADAGGLAHFGIGTLAAVSAPVVPGSGGEVLSGAGEGASNTGTGDDGGVAGDSGSGPGSSGDGSGDGDGDGSVGKLAFTGFAAAAVAALGAGLSAAGSKARKYLARR